MTIKKNFAKIAIAGIMSASLLGIGGAANASAPVTPQKGLSISSSSPVSIASKFNPLVKASVAPDTRVGSGVRMATASKSYTLTFYGKTYNEVFQPMNSYMYWASKNGYRVTLEYPHRISWFGDRKWKSGLTYRK